MLNSHQCFDQHSNVSLVAGALVLAFSSSESDSSLLELLSFFLAAATAGDGAGTYRQATHAFNSIEQTQVCHGQSGCIADLYESTHSPQPTLAGVALAGVAFFAGGASSSLESSLLLDAALAAAALAGTAFTTTRKE